MTKRGKMGGHLGGGGWGVGVGVRMHSHEGAGVRPFTSGFIHLYNYSRVCFVENGMCLLSSNGQGWGLGSGSVRKH